MNRRTDMKSNESTTRQGVLEAPRPVIRRSPAVGSGSRDADERGQGGRTRELTVLMRMLREQMPDFQPETRLWLSVVERAFKDAYLHGGRSPDSLRREASNWIESEDFETVLTAIGLHPAWVRAKLRRIGWQEKS